MYVNSTCKNLRNFQYGYLYSGVTTVDVECIHKTKQSSSHPLKGRPVDHLKVGVVVEWVCIYFINILYWTYFNLPPYIVKILQSCKQINYV